MTALAAHEKRSIVRAALFPTTFCLFSTVNLPPARAPHTACTAYAAIQHAVRARLEVGEGEADVLHSHVSATWLLSWFWQQAGRHFGTADIIFFPALPSIMCHLYAFEKNWTYQHGMDMAYLTCYYFPTGARDRRT